MSESVNSPAPAPPRNPATARTDETRAGQLVRSIPSAVIVVSIIIAAIAMVGLWNNNLRESRAELERLSLAAAEQTQWQLDRLDRLMQAGAVWLARMDDVDNIANLRLYERFQPRLQSLESVESLIVSNGQGTLRVITREVVAVPATAFDPRPLFELYRQRPDLDLIVGNAFWMQSGKTWVFPMSRHVLDPQGKLVGAITALIRADSISERFHSITVSDEIQVLLINDRGELLVGRDRENSDQSEGPSAIDAPGDGFFEDWRGLPPSSNLAFVRSLSGYPLHVIAILPRLAYQAKFRGDALLLIGIAAAAGAGLAAIAGILGTRVFAAHRRLREERDFIDTVMDSADAIVLVLDRNGLILRHNAAFAKLAMRREGSLPKTLGEICVIEGNGPLTGILDRALRRGRSDFESGLVGFKDRPVTIKWTVSPLPQSAGASGALVMFGFDITELRQSWRSLSRTNAAMEHVLALATAYYWVGRMNAKGDDLDAQFLFYSPGAEQFYGCTVEELRASTGEIVGRFVHPEDQPRFMRSFQTFLRSDNRRYDCTYRVRRPDGGYRHCIGVVEKVFDSEGKVVELIGVEQDISERFQANAMLAESAVKLRRAHRLANLCFLTMDAGSTKLRSEPILTGFSDETLETLGYAAERLNSDPRAYFDQVVDPEDRERFRAEWSAFMAAPTKGGKFQHRILRGDGSKRHVRMGVEKLSVVSGQPAQIVGVIQDVTEQTQRERDLLAAKRDAEIANRAKTEFLANMSHELRTPLNAVIGFSQLIRDQSFGPVDERYAGYAGDIFHSGMMLLDLINDILDMSRIETGRHRLSEDLISISSLIQDCAKLVSASASEGDVAVRIVEPDARLGLRADHRSIKQVLLNVLSNAVKFTPRGGSVTISAQLGNGGAMEIRVADTGIGIDPTVIKELFQPFRQADSQISRQYGGTGLGLAISQSLVKLHGGEIRLSSRLGQGTTVIVELPAERVVLADADDRKRARLS